MRLEKDGLTIHCLADWKHLAPPKRRDVQWVKGRSAFECAAAWCADPLPPSVPDEIAVALAAHPMLRKCQIISAMPEHRVRFDDAGGEPRNADLVALAEHPLGTVAISIEAKADEPFDRPTERVLADALDARAHGENTNAIRRIEQLAAALLPPREPRGTRLGEIGYQLLTAAAGALAYAHEVKAFAAVLIIHEFVTDKSDDRKHRRNEKALNAFVARLTNQSVKSLPAGTVLGPIRIPGIPLFELPADFYIGKVVRNLRRRVD
jgi:hypothetical protein